MSTDFRKHRVEVRRTREPIYEKGRPTGGVLTNLYSTDSYTVLNVELPPCRPEHIKVTLGSNAILVVAELHQAQEVFEKDREYILAELPYGVIHRVFPLPKVNLQPHATEAHIQNGLLTITIPTHERDAYLHERCGEKLSEEIKE